MECELKEPPGSSRCQLARVSHPRCREAATCFPFLHPSSFGLHLAPGQLVRAGLEMRHAAAVLDLRQRRSRAANFSSSSRAKPSSTSLRTSAKLLAAGLDGVATDQVDAEGRPHRRAHLRRLPGQSRPRKGLVHGAVPGDIAQPAALLGAGPGRVFRRRVGKGDLPGEDLPADLLGLLDQRVGGLPVPPRPPAAAGCGSPKPGCRPTRGDGPGNRPRCRAGVT